MGHSIKKCAGGDNLYENHFVVDARTSKYWDPRSVRADSHCYGHDAHTSLFIIIIITNITTTTANLLLITKAQW